MDGGQDPTYTCNDLIYALSEARKILGIRTEFVGKTDDSVNAPVPLQIITSGEENLWLYSQGFPRPTNHIKVNYWRHHRNPSDSDPNPCGVIYYMKGPRSRSIDPKNPHTFSSQYDLDQKDAAGICCDCDACDCCKSFPHDSTANVFMHPRAFRAYFNAGYRSMEDVK